MCLFIGKNSSFIAKSDIIVYKVLKTYGGRYVTPNQSYPVKLDNMLIPEEVATEKPYGFKYCIKGGAIHAYTSSDWRDSRFKAIIKKGTKFWIQDDLEQIAAEKLYITSEVVTRKEETNFSDYLEEGADVRLKDGRRCKLTDSFDKNDVIGVYGYNNQVIALECRYLQLLEEYPLPGHPSVFENCSNAKEDMDGYSNTKQFKSLEIKSEALDYCEELGKDWYIPALGQTQKVAENLLRINFTLKYLGKDPLPLTWFWSSTLRPKGYAWGCRSNGGDYWDDNGFDYVCVNYHGYVLPFLELS